jgi:hypothetical protein
MYPLLIKGFFTSQNIAGGVNTLNAITVNTAINNSLPKDRGNLVAIDLLGTNADLNSVTANGVSLTLGSSIVFNKVLIEGYNLYRIGMPVPMIVPGGQSLQFQCNKPVSGTSQGAVLTFYDNPYNNPDWLRKLAYTKLKTRVDEFIYTIPTGAKLGTQIKNFSAQVGQGNVCAVEVVAWDTTGNSLQAVTKSWFNLSVNGATIYETCPLAIAAPVYNRRRIFPIDISSGATFLLDTDTNLLAAGNNVFISVRLYYDETNN